MANLSKTTRDHEEIRTWAEERGGKPAHVIGTGSKGDIGMLRIDFPGYSGQGSLEPISWEQFFEKFDERGLSLLYQEKTAGGQRSNFNKLVSAETAAESEGRSRSRGKRASTSRGKRASTTKSASKRAASARPSSGRAKKAAKPPSRKSSGKKAAAKKTSSRRSGASNAARKSTAGKKGSSSGRRRTR